MVGVGTYYAFYTHKIQNSSGELGDVGDSSRLRCLHGKVDTTIFHVCVHVLLAPPSVLGV